MSKPRTKQPKDLTPFWLERGFRPELAQLPLDPNEDPKGEIAYQREFYKAAQLKPPRIPNPASFPNSPSAREYMQRNNRNALQARQPQDNAAQRQYDLASDLASKKSSSTSPASNYSATASRPSLPSIMSIPRGDETGNAAFGDQRQLPPLPPMPPGAAPVSRASYLETGPRGPTNTIRPFF